MKIKTSELEGDALDWAVAKATGTATIMLDGGLWYRGNNCLWSPSTDWSQCGPLIEEYRICIAAAPDRQYYASIINDCCIVGALGDDHLTAACRAIVAAKLGNEVDVPEELA